MSKKQNHKQFSPEYVCAVLLKGGLITEEQARNTLKRKGGIKKKLEKLRAVRQASATSRSQVSDPVTIIDVITSLRLDRADDPSRIQGNIRNRFSVRRVQYDFYGIDPDGARAQPPK